MLCTLIMKRWIKWIPKQVLFRHSLMLTLTLTLEVHSRLRVFGSRRGIETENYLRLLYQAKSEAFGGDMEDHGRYSSPHIARLELMTVRAPLVQKSDRISSLIPSVSHSSTLGTSNYSCQTVRQRIPPSIPT